MASGGAGTPHLGPPGCKWVVGIDVGTSGTAFAYAPIPAPGAPPVHPATIRVYGPGSAHGGLREGAKTATAVCMNAAGDHALLGIGDRAIGRFNEARLRETSRELLFFLVRRKPIDPDRCICSHRARGQHQIPSCT